MRVAWILQGFAFVLIFTIIYTLMFSKNPATHNAMILRSPAFNHEEFIPSKYTCDGENISPPIAIDNPPRDTQSFVLIMDDPDAPGGTWDHWLLYNLSVHTTRIGEGETAGGTQGKNSWGNNTYGGPCPPVGETHRYLFKMYALDTPLNAPEGLEKSALLEMMRKHVLETTTLMGQYTRIPS